MISPDGRRAASPCLLRTGLTQYGYGVQAPLERIPLNREVADDDGIYVTDTETGVCRLLISIRAVADALGERLHPPELQDGAFYCFHVKWNPQGTRLMLVLRYRFRDPHRGAPAQVVTVSADGSEIHLALTAAEWQKGGHHPNWCPDGEHILMNLKLDRRDLRFVRFRYDGTGLESLTDAVEGSGHPTLHPDGRHILTDEYVGGALAFEDGTVPIRWIDLEAGTEETVVRIGAEPGYAGPQRTFRVDQHPAWDRTYRYVVFNGCPDGTRRVYVADMSSLL
jgi:Tol biopolymer transport system component